MVKSKKLLSLFLAVVMVLSVFTVMASAYTVGEAEGSAQVEFKYSVEKVDTVPETAAGSAEWSADNIYAVTLWMKSALPVDTIIAPFHYNKTLFAPITLSDGECTYPYGAGLDQDTYYSDMGEGAIYAYSLGDYMNNTGMYKANGTTATTKALAKCIGLGNSNSAGVKIMTELVSPDHPNYAKWSETLATDTTGIVFAKVDVATNAKTAYLNTISGIETSTDWNRMFTLYFETITDADVTGAEFGIFNDTCFGPDACYDANGLGYYESAANYQASVPTINMVSNAVVEAAAEPSPVVPASSQIRFNGTEANGEKANFDVRARAMMTTEDFNNICEYVDKNNTNIDEVGFIFAPSSTGMTLDMAEAAIGGESNGCTKKTVDHMQQKADGYYWTCLVTNADYDEALDTVGYIIVDGTTYFFDAVSSTTYATLYNTYYSQYVDSLS